MFPQRCTRTGAHVRSSVAAALTAGLVVTMASGANAAEGDDVVYRYEFPQLAADTFTRTGESGWGAAETGGAWQHNVATHFGVTGSAGTLTVPRAGSTIVSSLPSVSSADTDMTLTVSPDKEQTGSGTHLTFVGRMVGSLEYGAKVRLLAGGKATLATMDAGTSGTPVSLPGTFAAGDQITVRLQVTGTSPTTVRAKAWHAGTAEPSAWQVTTTSSTAGLQTAGSIGLSAYVSSSATNAPYTFTYDDLHVTTSTPAAVPNDVPTAVIVSDVTDLSARFDGSGSGDRDGAITSYAWDLGDGTTSTEVAPSHTYAKAGTYTVRLSVTDNDGSTGTATTEIVAVAPNQGPEASFTASARDLDARFDASGSSDPDGTIESYAWEFGDGTTATGRTTTHTYATAGTYTASLTVTDDRGATATTTRTVTAVEPNKAPAASFATSARDLDATFDASGSSDPDGTIESYAWEFGDGTKGSGQSATHTYAKAGTYTVRLTVTDDRGATATTTNTVTAVAPNKAPVASFSAAAKDLVATLDASASSDPDGAIVTYTWSFGDGTTGTGRTVSHEYAKAGTYTVTLIVTDDRGAATSTSRVVTAVEPNKAPTASFTAAATDLAATFDASASSDPDGTIASYAWTFGDGTTGTGRTATHTYEQAGTYTVSLQVTDDAGARTSTSRTVTVTAPVSPLVAHDSFGATRTNGWGDALTGGTWTHIGAVGNYSTAAGTAKQVITTAGSTRTSSLTAVAADDTDTTVAFNLDKAVAGGATQVSVLGRAIGADGYSARVKYMTDGTAQLAAMEGTTTLKMVSLGQLRTTDRIQVRVQVTGTSPTTVNAKAWRVGTAEPADWQVSGTGSQATFQKAGHVALSSYMSSSSSTGAMTVSYQDLRVQGTSPATGEGLKPVEPSQPGFGVPNGTQITKVHEGNLTITADNTVIDSWDIRGYVNVKAKNVVIRNSYIRGTATPAKNDLVRVQGDGYSVTIENSTLRASTKTPDQDGVKGWNFTLRGVDISDVVDPVHIHGDNVLVEDSWLHDNAHFLEDPNWGGTPSHSDSIQIQKGKNIVIRNNVIEGAGNAAVMLTQDAGAVSNLQLVGNFIDGGACSVNIKKMTNAPANVTIADNTFGRNQVYKNCAVRVPTEWPLDMRNNTWIDGGVVNRTNI